MINVWELSASKKEVKKSSLEKWKLGGTLTWIDCHNPSDSEIEQVSKKMEIPASEFKIDHYKRPHIESYPKYSFILIKGISEKAEITSIGLFFFKKDIITIHHKPIKSFSKLKKLPKPQQLLIFNKGSPYFVYRLLDAITSDFLEVIDSIGEEIEKIEETVVSGITEDITKDIFKQKRTFIHIHKALKANRDVISALEKRYLKEFKEEDLKLLRNVYNDTVQVIDLETTHKEILTGVLDMYISTVSNNLNKIMKTLTIISAFILIPTLISGIYGMNFSREGTLNMPELYWDFGYFFALGLMALSIIITYWVFKRKKWL